MPESRERLTARKVHTTDVLEGSYHQQEGFDPNYVITPYGLTVSRARFVGTVVDTYRNEEGTYGAITLDDGTDTLRAKFFQELDMMDGVEIGDIVEVVGKVKEYDGEVYVNPELIVTRSIEYELLRSIEVQEQREKWAEAIERVELLRDDDTEDEDIMTEMEGEDYSEREVRAMLEFCDGAGERTESIQTVDSVDSGADEPESEQDPEDADRREAIVTAIEAHDDGEGASYSDIQDDVDITEDDLEDAINDLLSDGTCYEPRPGRIKKL